MEMYYKGLAHGLGIGLMFCIVVGVLSFTYLAIMLP